MARLRPTRCFLVLVASTAAACGAFDLYSDDSASEGAPIVTPVAVDPGPAGPSSSGATITPMTGSTSSTSAPSTYAPPPTRPIDDASLPELVQAARDHASVMEQRTSALVMQFVDSGLAKLDAGDLEGAYEEFAHAYEIDPTNVGARDLFQRTGALLGRDGATIASIAQSARDRTTIRRMQNRLLAENKVSQGRAALAADDPEAALGLFQEALSILRWNPEIASGALTERDVRALVDAARGALDAQRAARDAVTMDRVLRRQAELDAAEAAKRERRIAYLLEVADAAFLRDDYEETETALEEVLVLDPGNTDAAELLDVSRSARHADAQTALRRRYQDAWRATFDELRYLGKPQNDLITFPGAERWAEISDTAGHAFESLNTARNPEDAAIRAQLDEIRIPVAFRDEPLEQVIDHLQQVTGLNFLLSTDVRDEAIDNTYDLEDRNDLPVSRILDILLRDLSIPELDYTVRDGIVHVITTEESRQDYELRVYDIRDLTFTPTDYPTTDFNLLPSGTDAESFTEGVEDDEPVPLISEDTIVGLIQDNIRPNSWSDDPERTIQQLTGTLIVRQTPEVHAMIRDLLTDLRAHQTTMIHIETRFIEVEDSFLEDIGVDLRGLTPANSGGFPLEDFGQAGAGGFGSQSNPAGIGTGNDAGFYYGQGDGDLKGRVENIFDDTLGETGTLNNAGGLTFQALLLDDTNVSVLLRAVTKYQTSNIVNAPSVTLRSGQRGNVQVLTTRTYVRDYEPEIAQAAVIAQPELANVKEGMVLDVRPVASADRRFITMELRPMLAELVPDASGLAIRQEQISLATAASDTVLVELPELEIQRLRTTATVPDGGTLLLAGMKKMVEQDQQTGLPFLSDIPGLGFFFERKGQYKSARKLLILIKAQIIAPEEREPARRSSY